MIDGSITSGIVSAEEKEKMRLIDVIDFSSGVHPPSKANNKDSRFFDIKLRIYEDDEMFSEENFNGTKKEDLMASDVIDVIIRSFQNGQIVLPKEDFMMIAEKVVPIYKP